MGTNGAGKQLHPRYAGNVGKRERRGNLERASFGSHNRKVGYLAEERGLYPKYNIYNQLKYFATLKGMKPSEIKTMLDYWFERLNVNEYREKRPTSFRKETSKNPVDYGFGSDPNC